MIAVRPDAPAHVTVRVVHQRLAALFVVLVVPITITALAILDADLQPAEEHAPVELPRLRQFADADNATHNPPEAVAWDNAFRSCCSSALLYLACMRTCVAFYRTTLSDPATLSYLPIRTAGT